MKGSTTLKIRKILLWRTCPALLFYNVGECLVSKDIYLPHFENLKPTNGERAWGRGIKIKRHKLLCIK